jgi:hypothetical protein
MPRFPSTASSLIAFGSGAVKVVFHGPMATLQTRLEGSVAEPDGNPEEPVLLQSTAARVRSRPR